MNTAQALPRQHTTTSPPPTVSLVPAPTPSQPALAALLAETKREATRHPSVPQATNDDLTRWFGY